MYRLWLSDDGTEPGAHVSPLWRADERRRYPVVTGRSPVVWVPSLVSGLTQWCTAHQRTAAQILNIFRTTC